MKKLLMLVAVALVSCHEENGLAHVETTTESVATISEPKHQATRVNVSLFKKVNLVNAKHFSNITYEIEPYLDKVDLTGKMQCIDSVDSVNCSALINMDSLPAGIYRLVIKSDGGLLGSDVFEKNTQYQPLEITIDNESTGNYLISIITQQTGFREDEIYRRVAHILSYNSNKEYNLEPTVYDLFMSYNGSRDTVGAINELVRVITENKLIHSKVHPQYSGTLELVF